MSHISDLKKAKWELLKGYFTPKDKRGNRTKHARKNIVDAIPYVLKGGIIWRMLPTDFPAWQTVYDHFRKWNQQGIWEKILDALNCRHCKKVGKDAEPSYVLIDSQSVKTMCASD